ncbi:MAG: AraC family transcriptional regulator [Clostridia bacterium]|nr:AraC family transcriptional regulator [Clostridia bacterium]
MPLTLKEVQRSFSIQGFYTAFEANWKDDYVFHGESHDFWEIVFFEQGNVECVEDEKIYLVKDNCMLLHAPMEFHRIRSVQGTSPRGFILSFQAEGRLPEALKQGIFLLTEEEKEEYRAICKSIKSVVLGKTEPYLSQLAADRLSSFLIRLSEKQGVEEIVKSDRSESYHKIVSDMTKWVDGNRTLSDFATRQSVSVSYMKLLFLEYAGMSPKAYYNQLRVQRAVALLNQKLSIAEIAEKMNFSSQNYFTVFFRKHTGASPSEFRRKIIRPTEYKLAKTTSITKKYRFTPSKRIDKTRQK